MGRWAVVWAAAAAVAACGDPAGSAPDAARSDGAPLVEDGGTRDAAACDDTPFVPTPLACAQSAPWAGYMADTGDLEEVFVVRMAGDPGEGLLASGGHGTFATNRPTWGFSPDGAWMSFVSRDGSLPWQVEVAPLTDGGPGELRRVSGPFKVDGNVTWYAWSPDGRKIAYAADQAHDARELWVLDLAEDGYAQRVNPPLEFLGGVGPWEGEWPFLWSPDSTRLLYSGWLDDPEEVDLHVTDVSGSSPGPPVRLTDGLAGDVRRFAWSPDGRAVSFAVGSPDQGLYVARLSCDGVDGPWRVHESGAFEKFGADGDTLLYLAPVDGDDWEEVAVHRADLTVTPPVSSAATESVILSQPGEQYQWSPSGDRLAIVTGRRLVVLDATTGLRHVVNAPLVPNASVLSYAWSPDGDSIAYVANQDDDRRFELYHVDMSGPAPAQRRKVSPPVDHDVRVDAIRWSPDSTRLAYRANQDVETRTEIYAGARAGGVVGPPVKLNADLTRDGAEVFRFLWSPDSARMLYTANDAAAFDLDAYVVSFDEAGQATLVGSGAEVREIEWAPCPAP
jgi:Tol biopolymer transport system component